MCFIMFTRRVFIMASWDFFVLVDIYFPSIFFTGFWNKSNEEQDSDLPDIDKYVIQADDNWAFDIQRMSKEKPFSCFFSSDAEKLSDAQWNEINDRLCNEKPTGGLPRPFIDMEDDKYIAVINKISGHDFIRDDNFSVPKDFFNINKNFKIIAVYDIDKNTFIWDFSEIIRQFHPDTIHEAFQRFAHVKYNKISFGINKTPQEKNINILFKTGNDKIENELGKDNKKKIDWKKAMNAWEYVEDRLQGFPEKNPYQFYSFEAVEKYVFGQMSRSKKMGYNRIFDHNDESNIYNAWKDFTGKMASESEYRDAGYVRKVQILYNEVIHKRIKNKRRVNTIYDLYGKWMLSKSNNKEGINENK